MRRRGQGERAFERTPPKCPPTLLDSKFAPVTQGEQEEGSRVQSEGDEMGKNMGLSMTCSTS